MSKSTWRFWPLFAAAIFSPAPFLQTAAIAEPTEQKTVFPKSASFGVAPFDGATEAKDFAGFIDLENSRSVMINELPSDSWGEISKAFREEVTLEKAGITARTIQDVTIAGMEAFQISGTQLFEGRQIPKCLLIIRGTHKVGMISAQIPIASSPDTADEDACNLISGVAQRAPAGTEEKLQTLPYRLTELGGMRVLMVMSGSSVILTHGPLEQFKSTEQPALITAPSIRPTAAGWDRREFSRSIMETIALHKIKTVTSVQEMTVAGRPAVELKADATHIETGEDVNVVQWMIFAPDGNYFRMIGTASPEQWPDALSRFEAVRDGLDLSAKD